MRSWRSAGMLLAMMSGTSPGLLAQTSAPLLIEDLTPTRLETGSFPSRVVNITPKRAIFVSDVADEGDRLLAMDTRTGGLTALGDAIGSSRVSGRPFPFAGKAVFNTLDGPYQLSMWVTDGTLSGTQRLSRFEFSDRFTPRQHVVLGERVLFIADGNTLQPSSLWVSDGTVAGTGPVYEPPTSPYGLTSLVATNTHAAFIVRGDTETLIGTTDGTPSGTHTINTTSSFASRARSITGAANVGGRVIVRVDSYGQVFGVISLVSIDPLNGEARLVSSQRIDRYWNISDAARMVTIGGMTLTATSPTTPTSQFPLFRVTPDGLGMEPVRPPQAATSIFEGMSAIGVLNGRAVFFTRDATQTASIWSSDGSDAGTIRLGTFPASALRDIHAPVIAGGRAWFRASGALSGSGAAYGYISTDGTSDGTQPLPLPDAHLPSRWSRPADAGSRTLLARAAVADDGRVTHELWSTDGTIIGSSVIATYANQRELTHAFFNLVGSFSADASRRVFFSTSGDGSGGEPSASDGTRPGTVQLSDLHTSTDDSDFTPIAADSERLTLLKRRKAGDELWVARGTNVGLLRQFPGQRIEPLLRAMQRAPVTQTAPDITAPARVGYFNVVGTSRELWATDGTQEGTLLIEQTPQQLRRERVLGSIDQTSIIMGAFDTLSTPLLVSRGTPATTTTFIVPVSVRGYGVSVGDALYFGGTDAEIEHGVFRTDGTLGGTVPHIDTPPGQPAQAQLWFNNTLLFSDAMTRIYATSNAGSFVRINLFFAHTTTIAACPSFAFVMTSDLAYLLFPSVTEPPFPFSGPYGEYVFDGIDAGVLYRSFSLLGIVERNAMTGQIRLRSIQPTALQDPTAVTSLGTFALLSGRDPEFGGEPWITDGSDIGTRRLADINPGASSSSPTDFVRVGPLVYFIADDGRHGRELFAMSLCAGDFDLSGSTDHRDVLAFVAAWFNRDGRADTNADGSITLQDVLDFLTGYFAGCS